MSRTDPERRKWGPYIRVLANLMCLRDWTLVLSDEPPERHDNAAEVGSSYGRKRAEIYLSNAFLDSDEEEQRHIVCHELIHPHFAALDHYLTGILTDEQYENYKLHHEYGIDGITDAFAPALPLPSKVAAEGGEDKGEGRAKKKS